MKLFDIVGGKVVIHPDALGIPCFRNIWDNNKDKDYVRNIISYIVLKNKYDSPYVQSMDADEAERKLKMELFHDPEYKLTTEELSCEQDYKRLIYTRTLQMLNNQRKKLDSISKWYEDSLDDVLDEKRVKDIWAGMKETASVFKSLDALEKAVKLEELNSGKVRGGAELNPYELNN